MFERIYIVSNEIANTMSAVMSKECKQEDVASCYEDIIVAQHVTGRRANVDELNRAIVGRWSVAGLNRIKTMAWKRAEETLRRRRATDHSQA